MGDQAIRITSLGRAQRESVVEDQFGRRWQVRMWPLGYTDTYVVSYALPVPEGYTGMVQLVASPQLGMMSEHLSLLANDFYVNYSGTLPQWQAFLSRRELRAHLFDDITLDIDPAQGIRYESARLRFQLPQDVIQNSAESELELHMAYILHGDRLTLDVGALYLYKDQDRHTWVGVERHVKPADASAKDLLETWNQMSTRAAAFNGVAGHDEEFSKYWIHDAVSAPSLKNPGIDPGAAVLYDVYYATNASAYPRDMEDVERRLIQATHILER